MPARFITGAWLVVLALLVAVGAFGLWHLIVGGIVNGNPRAGGFGLGLAAASGALLALVAVLRRRSVTRPPLR
jgi:hypothetical protein